MRLEIIGKNHLFREALAEIFVAKSIPVRQSDDFSKGLDRLRSRKVETLLLIDLHEASSEALRLVRRVRKGYGHVRMLVLGNGENTRHDGMRCVIDGAAGYFSFNDSLANLEQAIDQVMSGHRSCSPEVVELLMNYYARLTENRQPDRATDEWFSPQKKQLLELLREGWTYARIARELHLTIAGLKRRIRALAGELGLRHASRVSIVRAAEHRGWI